MATVKIIDHTHAALREYLNLIADSLTESLADSGVGASWVLDVMTHLRSRKYPPLGTGGEIVDADALIVNLVAIWADEDNRSDIFRQAKEMSQWLAENYGDPSFLGVFDVDFETWPSAGNYEPGFFDLPDSHPIPVDLVHPLRPMRSQ